MANLKAFSDMANIVLQEHLRDKRDIANDERQRQARLEQIKATRDAIALEGEQNRQTARHRQYGENPALAFTASVSGDKEAEPFIEKDRQILAPAFEKIVGAKNPAELPSLDALFASRKPGIITSLQPFNELVNARNAQNTRIADSISQEVDQAGATAQAQAYGQAMGKEEADAGNFDAQLGREVKKTKTLDPLKFVQESKLANMRAAVELNKQKEYLVFELAQKSAFEDAKAVKNASEEAANLVLSMTELSALAFEVNKDYKEGAIDTMAGFKQAATQLPWVGNALGTALNTAGAASQSYLSNDPSFPRKVQNLEGRRRAAAIAAIRAAGDPRPSDADVAGVIGSIPGAFESLESSAAKAGVFRDAVTLIPELMARSPGMRGKALLDAALVEAQKRSTDRAVAGGTTLKSPNERGPAPSGVAAPKVVPPSVQSILSRP